MADSQVFVPAMFSVSPIDLIDPDLDADADEEMTADQVAYAELSRTIDTDDLLLAVTEALSDHEVLRAIIDAIKDHPFSPGERRHLHISECVTLGDVVATLIDAALDDAVGMRVVGRAE